MKTVEIWDKVSSINGVEANNVLSRNKVWKNATLFLVKEGNRVERIEDVDIIKSVYSIEGTNEEVMAAFLEILLKPIEEIPGNAVDSQVTLLLRMTINTMSLTDEQALQVKSLYPEWSANIGKAMKAGIRVLHENRLYNVRQAVTALGHQPPGSTGMAAIYSEINESNAGTLADPVPYDSTAGMTLEVGTYYVEEGIIYVCTREIAAVHPLSALVGHYVELA